MKLTFRNVTLPQLANLLTYLVSDRNKVTAEDLPPTSMAEAESHARKELDRAIRLDRDATIVLGAILTGKEETPVAVSLLGEHPVTAEGSKFRVMLAISDEPVFISGTGRDYVSKQWIESSGFSVKFSTQRFRDEICEILEQ